MADGHIESINAVTLAVHDMSRSVRFDSALGFAVRAGGRESLPARAGAGETPEIARPYEIEREIRDRGT